MYTDLVTSQIIRGTFQRGWLLLRRAIAVAELIGFPQIARSANLDITSIITPLGIQGDPTLSKAHLWESLLDLDKICGTMLNLPASTRLYESQRPRPLIVDGIVQDRAYLSRLAGNYRFILHVLQNLTYTRFVGPDSVHR